LSKLPFRVLVADDSETMRQALTRLLEEDGRIQVVGQAGDGEEAVALAKRLKPDVITMDVQMPRMSGLDAIRAIMVEAPSRILVVCALAPGRESEVDLSFRAVEAGALELVAKPAPGNPESTRAFGRRLAEAVVLMAEIPVITRRRGAAIRPTPRNARGQIDGIGLVASTGGPPTVARILSQLPANLTIPVFVSQHMAPGFTEGLARWFSHATPLPVKVAEAGRAPLPATVYLPPDGKDLTLDERGWIQLPPSDGGHWPSGDRMLESMARAYGARAAGVVLSGMGDDGARGLKAIRGAGGTGIAQYEESSTVFGMPRAAILAGGASWVLPAEAIGPTLRQLAGF
jgi:two-component system chemotaxis response regulator CheB